ncbi:hypothetical protein [Nitrosarchaeum sp. AC2]|uniref:hypothetical protein n=1 Tax=Nitrosarchaeum sp. AC2 TaxID=2259673 RepID=UPI0015CD3462|nr:hypothetical protein [Nitrosarchaeum sp. AC2]QLH10956.1 hypothetical protein DSQ20_05335 [Nitrosarchaeum sp. AC2]
MELSHEKNGGPYTKSEKRKRLDEVYRLHFEYGYSARKIADFLKVNRGTINRDIMYWYANISNKWRHLDPAIYVINQVERLELQRTRLRKQIDKVESFQEKIIIEKLVLDIDMKIANFQIRLVEATSNIRRKTVEGINHWYEKEKNKKRVFASDIFLEVSEKAREKIIKIYEEDRKF